MKAKCFLFLLISCIAFFACNNNNEGNANIANASTAMAKPTPTIATPDSIELYYYPRPQNQKEFETFWIKDTTFINALAAELILPAVERNACPHQVKMYLYKRGEVYKTIYAAVEDSCHYLAYAVNGRPYFIPFNNAFKNMLNGVTKQFG